MNKIAKIILWLVAIAALAYMAIIYNSVGLMIVAIFCLVFEMAEALVLKKQMAGLKIKLTTDTHMPVVGERIMVRALLHNPTRFPLLGVSVKFGIKDGQKERTQLWKGSIRAEKKRWASAALTSEHCKITEVTLAEVTGHSWRGFQKKTVVPEIKRLPVYVYPKESYTSINKLPRLSLAETEEIEGGMDKSAIPAEVVGVRGYQPGDRLQQINWKMTAKYDKIYVKEYVSYITCSYGIHVNGVALCQAAQEERDEKYQKLLSISLSLLNHKESHFICYELHQSVPRKRQESKQWQVCYPGAIHPEFQKMQKLVTKQADIYAILNELYQSVQAYDNLVQDTQNIFYDTAEEVKGRQAAYTVEQQTAHQEWIEI